MTLLNTDDHYIADIDNAYLDLSEFRAQLISLIAENRKIGVDDRAIVNRIYSKVLHNLRNEMAEPDDNTVVCRFLTPQKFLWFCALKSLHFSSPTGFDDPKECSIAEDYDDEVRTVLVDQSMSSCHWDSCSIGKAREWLISCWTKLDGHHDDNLLWHKYAGGPNGVGITVRYGDLKSLLNPKVLAQAMDGRMFCGLVDYGAHNCLPPFSKRKIFRSEKEVRFAFRHFHCFSFDQFDISDSISIFGLRFAPDAAQHHIEATSTLWRKCGWPDRIACQ